MFRRQGIYFGEPSQVTLNILVSFLHAFDSLLLLLFSRELVLLTSHHPHISALLSELDCSFFELFVDAHQDHRVSDQVGLDVPVERSVGRKGRSVVDLKQDRLDFFSDDDVKS